MDSHMKIFDAEFPLMQYIWKNHPVTAADLAAYALDAFGWKKNTTYTVLKRLIQRGALERTDPGFHVRPLVTQEEVLRGETDELIEKRYDGSRKLFLASFLSREDVSPEELELLRKAVRDMNGDDAKEKG